MNRTINHHAYTHLPYADVRAALERDTDGVLERATRAAARFAGSLAANLTAVSPLLDVDEDVSVSVSALRPLQGGATMELRWRADPDKRLLPNVHARLDINTLVDGPEALTELVLHGDYSPPPRSGQSAADFFLERRAVNATLHHFLDAVVQVIEAQE